MKKLLILLLTLALLLPVFAQAEHAAAPGATITVSGNATVTLKADYAQVTVGVSTKAPTVEEASQKNTAAIHAVISALTEAGVLEEDIATSNYSVNAEYDYSSMGGQRLTGYNVSNQLNVTIRDMEHIGATLDKATAAGANTIYNIQFLSTKADAAGLQLGNIVSITDTVTGYGGMPRTYKSTMDSAAGNSILPDDASVSASVTIVFELK